jgi:threonine/homoserine/homoserine lactone efflux protein
MNSHDFALFALASLMLNITPGGDMLYIISRSTTEGMKAGMISALGITSGCLIHIGAAVFGLSIIIMKSALAFNIIKYAGGAYLIGLGIQSLTARSSFDQNTKRTADSYFRIFTQGALINIFNPKVAIFFLAFLPQFVITTSHDIVMQILFLGLWFNFSGLIVNLFVAFLFGKSGDYVKKFPGFKIIQKKITGSVLIFLGCRIAFLKRS